MLKTVKKFKKHEKTEERANMVRWKKKTMQRPNTETCASFAPRLQVGSNRVILDATRSSTIFRNDFQK